MSSQKRESERDRERVPPEKCRRKIVPDNQNQVLLISFIFCEMPFGWTADEP
jgi:hypothetical protein